MRVLLAYTGRRSDRADAFERLAPVGLFTIAASLRAAGHSVVVANFSGSTPAETERELARRRPEVVGISAFTPNRRAALRLARSARRILPSCSVVLGGPHASHLPAEILRRHPAVDYVVLGEGEATFTALLDDLRAGRAPRPRRGIAWRRGNDVVSGGFPVPLRDLDAIPPACAGVETFGVDEPEQYRYVVTSRGCPGRCSFCNTPSYWGRRVRFRSVDAVLEELRLLRERWGVLYLSFRDDTFTAHRGRLLELCRRMHEERLHFLWDCQSRVNLVDREKLLAMRRAGCVHVQYGVESGSPPVLELLAKDVTVDEVRRAARLTREVGLPFSVYLITGVEGETVADVAATERLLAEMRPSSAMVSPLAVFPGTGLWERWKRSRGVDGTWWDSGAPEEVYALGDRRRASVHVSRIGQAADEAAKRSGFDLSEIARQREEVGDCLAIAIAEADLLASSGRRREALALLAARIEREPDDPWGLLRAGELLLEDGRPAEAAERLEALARRVPRSREAASLLERAVRTARRGGGPRRERRT